MSPGRIVIVGGGQAGLEAAFALRADGFDGTIILIGDETYFPYQRPPLSKAYLKERDAGRLILRSPKQFDEHRIMLKLGVPVVAIERARKHVALSSGETVTYDRLLLATGGRNRLLSIPGADAPNVLSLRSIDEADALAVALKAASKLAVIGGGFIGLEIAANARALGLDVTVLEGTRRLMGRSVLPPTADAVQAAHVASGIDLRLGACVDKIVVDKCGIATGVIVADGAAVEADLVLVAVGLTPNVELAVAAGLAVDNGIVVDEFLTTSDPAICAIGDCARFPGVDGAGLRVESVQNAVAQAKRLSANLMKVPAPYRDLPWFWSDQGTLRLQTAGLTTGADKVVSTAPKPGSLVVQAFRSGVFVGIETINAPAEFVRARRVLSSPAALSQDTAQSLGWDIARYADLGTERQVA
jgi:3-phenylpropionate/trans-cinnamate dioxygenase ferredoxin reductase subunit